MKYNELISELEYWKSVSGEDDPEIVVVFDDESYEIALIDPAQGLDNKTAIGLTV